MKRNELAFDRNVKRYTLICSGAPIVKVGCGADFSMILDCNGVLHSFGLPEYGQLGEIRKYVI